MRHDTHPFRSLRVLVIEDNQDLAENIGDYLEDHGHVVDFAMDGISGLHLALTQSIALFLIISFVLYPLVPSALSGLKIRVEHNTTY